MCPHNTIHTVPYHTILRLQQMQQSNVTETKGAVFFGEGSAVASQRGEHSDVFLHLEYCSI